MSGIYTQILTALGGTHDEMDGILTEILEAIGSVAMISSEAEAVEAEQVSFANTNQNQLLTVTAAEDLNLLEVVFPTNANSRLGQEVRLFTEIGVGSVSFINVITPINFPSVLILDTLYQFQKVGGGVWVCLTIN